MNIDLGSVKQITIQPLVSIEARNLTILRMVDLPTEKQILVIIKELPGRPVILWEGAAYDLIGQWTDSDVVARLSQVGILT